MCQRAFGNSETLKMLCGGGGSKFITLFPFENGGQLKFVTLNNEQTLQVCVRVGPNN